MVYSLYRDETKFSQIGDSGPVEDNVKLISVFTKEKERFTAKVKIKYQ